MTAHLDEPTSSACVRKGRQQPLHIPGDRHGPRRQASNTAFRRVHELETVFGRWRAVAIIGVTAVLIAVQPPVWILLLLGSMDIRRAVYRRKTKVTLRSA